MIRTKEKEFFRIWIKKKQLLTSLISEINKPQPKKETIVNGLTKLERETKKETILLQKIKHLEEQLRKTQALSQQEKQRADQAEQLLQKIGYYQQLEQEQNPLQRAQIIQPPPLKIK